MTELIFIRHGQSIANEQGKFAGHSDFDLTSLGFCQAELAAKYIKENFKVDAIYASDLSRAYNTAVPTAKAFSLPIHADTALREIYAGKWESLHKDDIQATFAEDFGVWMSDIASARCTCGESTAELYERVCKRVLEIARENEGKTVVLATHATPIRAVETLAQGFGAERLGDVDFVANAAISIYKYENGKIFPVRTNITEHLGDMVTKVTKFEPRG